MFEKEAEEFERRKHYRYEDNDYCGDIADGIIQAYLAGAEFGYNKANEWHKIAEGDYPPCEKDNYSIKVLTDCGNIVYYNYDEECWVAEPASVEIDPPITWCKIPKYKE